MNLKIKGKVVEMLPVQTGTSPRGEWKKQEIVVETSEDQYPKKICFTIFNKLELLNGISRNSEVEVSFNIKGREYNGKWFHNINAYRIDALAQNDEGALPTPPPFSINDMPVADEKDDLPF